MTVPNDSGTPSSNVLPDAVPGVAELYRVPDVGGDIQKYICLDRNERLQPLPDWFMQMVRQNVTSDLFTNYPVQDRLQALLARHLGLPEEKLLLTQGSDAAFKALYHAYVRPGDGVVALDPSYAMYPVYAQMFGARLHTVPFGKALDLDIEVLLSSIQPGVRLVMLANPNQPTGTLLGEDVVAQLVERSASVGALLVVDEAYFPFSHSTVLPWVQDTPNLVVTRTFSKAAGLAGLRVGYAAGSEEVIANIFRVRSTYDVSSMAVLCASLVLQHPRVVDDYVAQVEAGGLMLARRATALGLTPLPTYANFLLIRVGHRCPPHQLVDNLRHQGYIVRGPFSAPCLEDCIRVTLGPPELMASFADALEQGIRELA